MEGTAYKMTREQAEAALMTMTPQAPELQANMDYTNGVLRSSKEMFLSSYNPVNPEDVENRGYSIFHGIDGTLVDFTHEQAAEVLMGTRDAWDGEVVPDDTFECEKCFDEFDIDDSIQQDSGELWCPKCAGKDY